MSHNTSAQGAPVTSQEAEAREAVLKAYDESGSSPTFETDEAYDAAFFAALDAYAAVIRASERERYAALVEGVRALHNGHGGTICNSACHALAALEEAGSA